MSDVKESLQDLVAALRTERDELRVTLNLAKMEVRDHWEAVEEKWQHLEPKIEQVGHEASESAKRITHEIQEAYRHLRGQ